MTNLSEQMIAKANAEKLPADHPLRVLAVKFDEAAEGFYGTPQTKDVKQFLGAYARARRCWCDATGEPLV